MTATQQFIEDAIKGGFRAIDPDSQQRVSQENTPTYFSAGWQTIEQTLLDPLAWQAVGKTRGWSEPEMMKTVYEDQGIEIQATGCFAQQLYFTALLVDGLTIEDSLTKLQ